MPRKAYKAAVVEFISEVASLKSLSSKLRMPAAAVAGASWTATPGVSASRDVASEQVTALGISACQLRLQQTVTDLQQALQDLDSKAPLQEQVDEFGGSEQQWQEIVNVTQTGLDAAQVHI